MDGVFRQIPVSHPQYQAFVSIMDASYRPQVRQCELESVAAKARKKLGKSKVTTEELDARVSHYEVQHLQYNLKVNGHPGLAGLGSARNVAVGDCTRELIWAIAKVAVPRNLGLFHGDWYAGCMGVYKEAWLSLKRDYMPGWAMTGGVPLKGQELLDLSHEALIAVPEWYRTLKDDALSPPFVSFIARTMAIVANPLTCGCLYSVPGRGTKEEFSRIRLERQMRRHNLTAFSWRTDDGLPPDFCLDQLRRSGTGWVWDHLLDEAAMQVEEGTINAADNDGLFVIRLGKPNDSRHRDVPLGVKYFETPEEAASFVVTECYNRYRCLKEALAHELEQNGNGNGNGGSAV
jgi:hypothetical protein